MALNGKLVTVFGGSGFLGRHIVRRLAQAGAIVQVPTRDLDKVLPLKPMGGVGQIVPRLCSVRHDDAVARAIGGADAVINLIGILYEKGGSTFQAIHVEAAARFARLAHEQGARHFVHLSALGACADSPSAYARSKAAGEQAVRTFFPAATILRPGIVFGAEDNFFNMFARQARFSPFLPQIGGGQTKFQPVFVGDVADAALQALLRPEACGQTYDLAGPEIYSFRALLEMMLAQTGRRRALVPLPWWLANVLALGMELFPHPALTRDQVRMLRSDNVLGRGATPTFQALGISPRSLKPVLPTYLGRR